MGLQHVAPHVADERAKASSSGARRRGTSPPTGHGARKRAASAVAVGHHAGFVVTIDEPVVQGIGTGRRQAFHQVRAPSGRDDVPRLGIFEQVEAAFAVAPPGDLVEEAGPGEVNDASQYADHRALLVADRHGHAEDGVCSDGSMRGELIDDLPSLSALLTGSRKL